MSDTGDAQPTNHIRRLIYFNVRTCKNIVVY